MIPACIFCIEVAGPVFSDLIEMNNINMRYFRICALFVVLFNVSIASGRPVNKCPDKHQSVKNDSVSVSWLPPAKGPARVNSTSETLLKSFLAPLNGTFRPLVCEYNQARLVTLLTFTTDQ